MKIVILDSYAANPGDLDWRAFEALGEVTRYDRTPADLVIERIGDAEAVLVNKVSITRAIIEACPNLKYIGILATGYNIVDLAAAKEHGIPVCNVPAYSTEAVAQHVFALLLEVTNLVAAHSAAVHAGEWISAPDFCFWRSPLTELAGKTMGIVGYGQIGQAVARIAEAFGMQTLACASRPREGLATLEQVLRESDVISLHCPLFENNRGMINAETIAMMKDGAILINTARGPLIDEQAVADALRSGKLRAAALDVVSVEPMRPDSPLIGVKNCIITPHIAWAPAETRARLLSIAAGNLRSYMEGTAVNDVTAR